MSSILRDLTCTKCGAPVEEIGKNRFKCPGCGTIFILDHDLQGDNFLYQQIEVEKIQGGQIAPISNEIPVKQIVVKEVKLAEDFDLEVSKDTLLLNKAESIAAIRAFLYNNDYQKASEVVDKNFNLGNQFGELYFFRILIRKNVPNVASLFAKDFNEQDKSDLDICLSTASPKFVKEQLKMLISNVMNDDVSSFFLLQTILPYAMSEQVFSPSDNKKNINNLFELVIAKSYKETFKYLLGTLQSDEVEAYIKYNLRFAKKCPNHVVARQFIKEVLKVDQSHAEALYLLVVYDLAIEGISLKETFEDFKKFISYSSNPDASVLKVLNFIKNRPSKKLSHRIADFIKKALGCYSLGFEKLNDLILDYAYAYLKAAYDQKLDILYKDAESFLYLCLSINHLNTKVYWGLCLLAIKAYDDLSAMRSPILLKGTPYFTKYVAITDGKEEQKHAFEISNGQERRMRSSKKLKKVFLIVGLSVGAVVTLYILFYILLVYRPF